VQVSRNKNQLEKMETYLGSRRDVSSPLLSSPFPDPVLCPLLAAVAVVTAAVASGVGVVVVIAVDVQVDELAVTSNGCD
jgi:hypothetical protein